jgi:glycosyltransferase involved in cell wall biosynthesis
MDSKPRVSVTIPFLNGERFLAEAIESVLAQTYRSWELLLVDDGSSDGSTAIAQRYTREWPGKIRYFEHPGHENRGMIASRNLGLKHSVGEYIARLDADDVLIPSAFEDQVALLDAHPSVAMVYGPYEIWTSWSNGSNRVDALQSITVPFNIPLAPPTVLLAFLNDGRDEPASPVVRREVMEQVGGYTGQNLQRELGEDEVLYVKICLRYPVIASDRRWYRYRQHSESYYSVAREKNEMETAYLLFLEWVGEFFSENRVSDPELWEVLRRALERQRAIILYAENLPLPSLLAEDGARNIKHAVESRLWGSVFELKKVCDERLDLIQYLHGECARLLTTTEERLQLINELTKTAEERLMIIKQLDAEVRKLSQLVRNVES